MPNVLPESHYSLTMNKILLGVKYQVKMDNTQALSKKLQLKRYMWVKEANSPIFDLLILGIQTVIIL